MKVLLKGIIEALGKAGLIDVFFPIGTKIVKILLPKEGMIKVGKHKMIIEPGKDLGLYFGYEGVEPGVIYLLKRLLKGGIDILKGYHPKLLIAVHTCRF